MACLMTGFFVSVWNHFCNPVNIPLKHRHHFLKMINYEKVFTLIINFRRCD